MQRETLRKKAAVFPETAYFKNNVFLFLIDLILSFCNSSEHFFFSFILKQQALYT